MKSSIKSKPRKTKEPDFPLCRESDPDCPASRSSAGRIGGDSGEFGATVITQDSPSYPKSLREIHAPPIVLYVWGELQERDHHAIGIIGARRTTHYGTESAKKLAYQIAYAGLTVISGLARGIDTAAHQGALAAKGRTIAVIGSGLLDIYPPENDALAEKIRNGNGAVVSEFSMEIEPDRQTFPMRNRIISGWSHGVLVVEAGLNSGALITASQALEQGRSVYAVPGHINAPSAMGSNRLIQQGAKLVMSASDILDDLQVLLPETKPSPEAAIRPLPELSSDERRVYDAIEASETPIDQIAAKCDLPSATVSSTLLRLELKHLVKQLPGKYFVKLG